jgi:DNA-binding transcriptional LysR family regulator
MELADLQVFTTVVEEGGIAAAARKLHRVPSSVTTRVQHLEAALGVRLFVRERQRLHLSAEGERLLTYADRLLRLADEARSAVAGLPGGVLRLGALESTTASRLPAVLARFHRVCPDVRVELITGTNDVLTAAVAERRLDAAFVAEAPASSVFDHLPLFAETLVVITALTHPPVTSARDVRDDSVIAFPHRVRIPPGTRALARARQPSAPTRARTRLVPRHRGLCRLWHRGSRDARVGARGKGEWRCDEQAVSRHPVDRPPEAQSRHRPGWGALEGPG